MPSISFICSSCEGETRNDFPKVLLILDLDQSFVNERLNTFNPLKQNTTNSHSANNDSHTRNAIDNVDGIVLLLLRM
jgi:hypothetical protein